MSDSSSDDDVPLSQLQAPAKPAAKPKPKKKPPPSSSSDDDDEPVEPPPKKRAKPKPKYKESSDDDDSDSSDDEPIQKKRAARKPAKRKAPAKKEPAPKRRKSSTGSTARKPKQLTKVQRLEKALGANLEVRRWPHYSGNVWWARCDYIRQLPPLRVNKRDLTDAGSP